MHHRSRTGRLLKYASLAALVAAIPACHNDSRAVPPYVAARPNYAPPEAIRPVRIGGYAGYNYGRRPGRVPVVPVEDLAPAR